MKLIERTFYLKKLISVMGTPDIKVITGVRRSGKSKLFEAFRDYLESTKPNSNIIHINFNLPENKNYASWQPLYEYISSRYKQDKENFVLIDEVQMCKDFEQAINGLHACEKYDIYITGSNAFLLSSDLATLFTGRTFEISVYPFSFAEYLQYYNYTDLSSAFEKYIKEGGMAGSYLYNDLEDKYKYLSDVFNTMIVRDIQTKYDIRNTQLLDRITDFILDNVSNLTSSCSIAKALESAKDKVNHNTVGNYLQYLCNAFVFYKVRRYDIKGKKYLNTNDKYYLCDQGFRYAKLGTRNMDYGRVMENIVALELLRRGYELYVGILYNKEIDFIALKQNEKLYIQVSDDISNPDTFSREVSPLLQIKDAYPKIILANTKHDQYQHEGIQIIDLAHWLTQ